jgi:hypothetical protein
MRTGTAKFFKVPAMLLNFEAGLQTKRYDELKDEGNFSFYFLLKPNKTHYSTQHNEVFLKFLDVLQYIENTMAANVRSNQGSGSLSDYASEVSSDSDNENHDNHDDHDSDESVDTASQQSQHRRTCELLALFFIHEEKTNYLNLIRK